MDRSFVRFFALLAKCIKKPKSSKKYSVLGIAGVIFEDGEDGIGAMMTFWDSGLSVCVSVWSAKGVFSSVFWESEIRQAGCRFLLRWTGLDSRSLLQPSLHGMTRPDLHSAAHVNRLYPIKSPENPSFLVLCASRVVTFCIRISSEKSSYETCRWRERECKVMMRQKFHFW